ncbi:hypothetical protein [Staphylospora marina]|uniref:hypothetical protein n=1 Tax=Staphylospora marina TaxID=2490858 RepID=UPI000F5BAC77|nr:hypothetical protein [Staphylospora marina]
MGNLSIREIGSSLPARRVFSGSAEERREEPPHVRWDDSVRTVLVILWGLLVYPQLDPDLRDRRTFTLRLQDLSRLFPDYVGDSDRCAALIERFREHDYVRVTEGGTILPGTNLMVAVDAAKMYAMFRSSVLSRQLFRQLENGKPLC